MSKQQKKREPLLYIHQPTFRAPKGNMQETFSVRKAEERKKQLFIKKELEETKVETEEKILKKKKRPFEEDLKEVTGGFRVPLEKKEGEHIPSSEEVQKEIEQYDEHQRKDVSDSSSQKQDSFFKRVKSFKEMNINERIDYLYHFPKQLPPVPCLFQTEGKAVRGFLIGMTSDMVELRLLDKTELSIPIKELTEVKMIGLV